MTNVNNLRGSMALRICPAVDLPRFRAFMDRNGVDQNDAGAVNEAYDAFHELYGDPSPEISATAPSLMPEEIKVSHAWMGGLLNNFQKAVHQLAIEKGWYDTSRTFGDYIALFHSEISEAFEEYRNGVSETAIYFGKDGLKPEGVPIELADEIIRILDYCEVVGIDMEHALVVKHRYNATRPYRHGGKTL